MTTGLWFATSPWWHHDYEYNRSCFSNRPALLKSFCFLWRKLYLWPRPQQTALIWKLEFVFFFLFFRWQCDFIQVDKRTAAGWATFPAGKSRLKTEVMRWRISEEVVLEATSQLVTRLSRHRSTRHRHVSSHSQLVTSEHITKPPVPVVIIYTPSASGDIQKQCSTRTA